MVDPAVLILTRVPEFLPSDSPTPVAEHSDARNSPEGRYAVYDAGLTLQLLFLPGATARHPLAALVPLDGETMDRIHALTRLWRNCRGLKPLTDTRMTALRRRRLRLMMQAVDGRSNGASYREIAIAIYGRDRVAAEPWKTSPLRDSVIGLVEGGVAMIGGGYLDLLRHRRRS